MLNNTLIRSIVLFSLLPNPSSPTEMMSSKVIEFTDTNVATSCQMRLAHAPKQVYEVGATKVMHYKCFELIFIF